MEAAFTKRCRELGVEDRVHRAGYLSDASKFAILEESRLFLMTSAYEGFPNVVVESLTAGVPVIAYDYPFHRVFREDVVARVAPADPVAMGAKAAEWLQDEEGLRERAAAAAQYGQSFRWDRVADEILDALGAEDEHGSRGGFR